jgi:PEP-CTERM motif
MKLLTLLLVIAGCSEASNLVQNGGFETGDFQFWTPGGDTSSLFVVRDFNSNSGTYAAVFSFIFSGSEDFSTGPSLSQSFTTDAGASYVLSYELSDLSSDPNGFQALWNGSVIPGSPVIDVTDFGYTLYQFTVLGTGADTLQFQSYQDDLSDWFLDDVTLNQSSAPEPSSLLLIAAGIIALLFRVFLGDVVAGSDRDRHHG